MQNTTNEKIRSCDEDCASGTHRIELKIFLEAQLTTLYNISKNQSIPRYHSIVGVCESQKRTLKYWRLTLFSSQM